MIEDAGARRVDQVWRHFGVRTPAEDPLSVILDTVRRVASNVQVGDDSGLESVYLEVYLLVLEKVPSEGS